MSHNHVNDPHKQHQLYNRAANAGEALRVTQKKIRVQMPKRSPLIKKFSSKFVYKSKLESLPSPTTPTVVHHYTAFYKMRSLRVNPNICTCTHTFSQTYDRAWQSKRAKIRAQQQSL